MPTVEESDFNNEKNETRKKGCLIYFRIIFGPIHTIIK